MAGLFTVVFELLPEEGQVIRHGSINLFLLKIMNRIKRNIL
jgi:hypothetical protein